MRFSWPWQRESDTPVQAGVVPDRLGQRREQWGNEVFTEVGGGVPTVSPADAVPAAKACIDLLTQQMTELQPQVLTPKGEPLKSGPLAELLGTPSQHLDHSQFWSLMYRPYFARGNSYAYIRRTAGRPVELIPAYATSIRWVRENRKQPYREYYLQFFHSEGMAAESMRKVRDRDVICFHGPGYNGLVSPSPVRLAAMNYIEVMDNVIKHQATLTSGMLSSGSVIQVNKDGAWNTSPKQIAEFKKLVKLLNDSMKAAKEADALPTMPPGVTIERIQTLTNQDLQLIQIMEWGVAEMARIWGVPPARIGQYFRGYRSTDVEARGTEFERFSIAPHTTMSNEQMTYKLIRPTDRMKGMAINSDTMLIKRGTFSERVEAAKMGVSDGGFMTINEGRAHIGLPPVANGDRLLMPKGAPYQDKGAQNED